MVAIACSTAASVDKHGGCLRGWVDKTPNSTAQRYGHGHINSTVEMYLVVTGGSLFIAMGKAGSIGRGNSRGDGYRPKNGQEGKVLVGRTATPAKVRQAKTMYLGLSITIAASGTGCVWAPLHHPMRIAGSRKNIATIKATTQLWTCWCSLCADEWIDVLCQIPIV